MSEQEKPFDTTSIVLLLLVAGLSDLADLATAFIFLVPVIGQVVFLFNSLFVSPIVWAIIQLSFIMKTGAGRVSLIAALGGLGNMANIPGSETITTAVAIAIANNPKVSQAVGMVSGGAAVKKTVTGEIAAETGEAGAAKIGAGRGSFAEKESAEGESAEKPKAGRTGREISPEELGEEPEPMEKLQERLFKETPASETGENDEEGDVYVDGDKIDLRNV